MNKQELIDKYASYHDIWNATGAQSALECFLRDLDQLDEPQKPVIPQFVADWYEENKDEFETNLFKVIYLMPPLCEKGELNKFEKWVNDENTKPFQTLVNMHQFGYEVEKEKRYRVKMKGVEGSGVYLNHDTAKETWALSDKRNLISVKTHHTRKELEDAGFGWVFDCEGVEVKEVEE